MLCGYPPVCLCWAFLTVLPWWIGGFPAGAFRDFLDCRICAERTYARCDVVRLTHTHTHMPSHSLHHVACLPACNACIIIFCPIPACLPLPGHPPVCVCPSLYAERCGVVWCGVRVHPALVRASYL
mmetsp:Transcript_12497/g.36263  ORF Transcript_12497/g.36263 Transcript_12497/m.36263 type:complete len:126 (+) Transcript_12497:42-419(+)